MLIAVVAAIGGSAGVAAAFPPVYATTTANTPWTELIAPSGGAPSLFNVSCPDAADCYAVGQAGTVKAGSATTAWSGVASGTPLDLFGVACASTTTCFAAGGTTGSGVVVGTTTGVAGWHVMLTTSQQLNGISCSSTTTCVAVGENGLIERSVDGGASWAIRASGTVQTLYAVSCPAATISCLAVGGLGTYDTSGTSGAGWQLHSNGSIQELRSVWCMSRSRCIVGTSASAWVVTGFTTWTQVDNNASYEPWCVS
ncbi:MAG TPA: hypothetical protein VKJ07_16820, partial [Mycobacteriales bacterium]|nr:hypothetical protein [Mycobacteriales bacterium]